MTDDLFRLERALAERDDAAIEGGLAALLAPDFFEFGASGRTWDRESTIATLFATPPPGPLEFRDWATRRLAEDLVLVTYTLTTAEAGTQRTTRRSSIWRGADGRWQITFHQGTPVPHGAP